MGPSRGGRRARIRSVRGRDEKIFPEISKFICTQRTRQSCINQYMPQNPPQRAPIRAPGVSIAKCVSVWFWQWYSFCRECPSREASTVYLSEQKKRRSCINWYENKYEPQGLTKAHRQQQKTGHSPWELRRASRALGGAIRVGMGLVYRQRRRASGCRT